MDRHVIRTPTWKTLNYTSMAAENLAQKTSILTNKTLTQTKKNSQKKPLQLKQLSDGTQTSNKRFDELFRSKQVCDENVNGNSNDSGLSSASSISPQHKEDDNGIVCQNDFNSNAYINSLCTPTQNDLGKLADNNNYPAEKENDKYMTIKDTQISQKKTLESGINFDEIVKVVKILPTKAEKAQRQLQNSNNMIMARIQRDLNSPSAATRLKAIKALKSPTKSAYSHFDIPEAEQSLNIPEPPSLKEIMRNIVVYVEVRSGEDNRSAGVRKFIEALGARVNLSLLRDTTHVVFKDGLLSTFKKATQMGIPIVSILWIEACKNECRICDPKDYPISNLDRYENPELYTKIKRIKSMQPDSECNKRIRAKGGNGTPKDSTPTQKTGALKKTSSLKSDTPTSSINKKKTDISQFFKKLEKSTTNSTAKIGGGDCNTILESPATQFLRRINSESYTPKELLKSKYQRNEICNKEENLKEQTQQQGIKLRKALDFLPDDSTESVIAENEKTISSINLKKAENVNNRRRRSSVTIKDQQITENKSGLQVTPSSMKKIRPQRRHSLMPVSEVESTTQSMNSLAIAITPKKGTRRRNSMHTPKDMSVESPKIVSNIETITEERNTEEISEKLENLPKSVNKRRTLYSVATKDQTDHMEVEKNNEQEKYATKSTRRRTIYGSKTIETSEIKIDDKGKNTFSVNARRRTCYSVKSMEQSTEIIDTIKTTPIKNNKVKELNNEAKNGNEKLINGRRILFSPAKERLSNTESNVTSSLSSVTSINFQTDEIASSTLLDSVNKSKLYATTKADSTSGKLVEETDQCITPLIFSSTRLPSNRRRTLFDVSMDIITQRLQCINQSARRSLAPTTPSCEATSPNERITNTLNTKNSASTETLSESNGDKGETTAIVLTPKKNSVKMKRKLFFPNEFNTPASLNSSVKDIPNERDLLSTPLNHVLNNSVKKRRRTLMPISQPQTTVVALKSVEKNIKSTPGVKKRRSTLDFEQMQNIKTKNSNLINSKIEPSTSSSSANKKAQVLVYTNMHHQQIDVIREAINKLGLFQLESSVTDTTTHLVSLEPRRTLNLLKALVRGLWILNYTWVSDSLNAGKWLPEDAYEFNNFSKSVEICRSERQAFGVNYKCELFRQIGAFYISSHCYPLKKEDMRELIRLCGGRVVNNRKNARYIIGNSNRFLEDKIHLTPYWILDSITHMQLMKINKYMYPLPKQGGRN